MSYKQYGIEPQLVERIKKKLKQPECKERAKKVAEGVTKADLQDRVKVKKLLAQMSKALAEPISEQQGERIVQFVIAQKIDPNNTFHLLKLWGMFR